MERENKSEETKRYFHQRDGRKREREKEQKSLRNEHGYPQNVQGHRSVLVAGDYDLHRLFCSSLSSSFRNRKKMK